MTDLERQYNVSYKMVGARKRLIQMLRSTGEDLLREAEYLETGYPGINSLGILQSRGPAIDNAVGEYSAYRELLQSLQDALCTVDPEPVTGKDLAMEDARLLTAEAARTDPLRR